MSDQKSSDEQAQTDPSKGSWELDFPLSIDKSAQPESATVTTNMVREFMYVFAGAPFVCSIVTWAVVGAAQQYGYTEWAAITGVEMGTNTFQVYQPNGDGRLTFPEEIARGESYAWATNDLNYLFVFDGINGDRIIFTGAGLGQSPFPPGHEFDITQLNISQDSIYHIGGEDFAVQYNVTNGNNATDGTFTDVRTGVLTLNRDGTYTLRGLEVEIDGATFPARRLVSGQDGTIIFTFGEDEYDPEVAVYNFVDPSLTQIVNTSPSSNFSTIRNSRDFGYGGMTAVPLVNNAGVANMLFLTAHINGGQSYLYDIENDSITEIGHVSQAYFLPGGRIAFTGYLGRQSVVNLFDPYAEEGTEQVQKLNIRADDGLVGAFQVSKTVTALILSTFDPSTHTRSYRVELFDTTNNDSDLLHPRQIIPLPEGFSPTPPLLIGSKLTP